MKKSKYILLIFLFFFFLVALTVIAFVYSEFRRPPEVEADSFLEIDLAGPFPELSAPDFLTAYFLGGRALSVHDVWEGFRMAKADDRIRCVLLRLGYLECDWAKISEVRDAVRGFRKSGKKVYAYIEEAPDFDKEYYLATACDRIILHPLGWLGVNGIGGWVPFFKEGLDKLGIEAHFEHVEEYKTAYNMFTEKGFTEAHKLMMDSLYQDIFSEYVRTVAEARKKTEAEVRAAIDKGLYQGEQALEAGLVDDLLYEDELASLLQDRGKKLKRTRFSEYIRTNPGGLGLETGRKVALLYATGPIIGGEGVYSTIGSRTLSQALRRAREDRSITAIVLRVDSPGGSAVASDVIWRETFLAKKAKPLVISMSDMAGSGGYWISMAGHRIVAQPQTLTGSIGVLAGKFSLAGLYDKLGITAERLTYGQRADLFSTFRPFSPEEREFLKQSILWTYDKFLTKAAEGRNLTREEVDKVGRGRVWTGRQALEIKLIDELGGLDKALDLAKSLAGIPADEDVKLVVWPHRTSLFGAIFGRQEIKADLISSSELGKRLQILRVLEKENPWAVMPFWLPPR
jgi:protease IV